MTRPDPAAVAAALRQLRGAMDEGEANEPHAIVVTDPQTGVPHVVGPYPNRLLARVGLEFLRAAYLRDDPELANLQYRVVLCFAPEVSGG